MLRRITFNGGIKCLIQKLIGKSGIQIIGIYIGTKQTVERRNQRRNDVAKNTVGPSKDQTANILV